MRVTILRAATVAAITGMSVLGAVTPVRADGWGDVDCAQAPSPDCELTAGGGSTSGGHVEHGDAEHGDADAGGSAPATEAPGDPNLANCGYRPSGYRPPAGAVGSGVFPGDGVWVDGVCSTTGVIRTPEYVAALTSAAIARLARSQLRLPAPGIAANPAGDQLVNLPTWLWLSSGWGPVSATASVPGVSVTAVATPTSVSWSMGDGTTVTCTGAGTPFRPGTDPMAPSPDCGHTYRTSSASQVGHVFPVTATVRWTVTWSGAGQSGTFPGLTTSGNTAFRVAESQALNNGGG